MQTETDLKPLRSHLFLVRIWDEELGDGRKEWRGKVQHAASGNVQYFRDWQLLPELVQHLLNESA
ncbi:MAG: hypothetical protein LC737_09575, partial [Chloroflexi bacterium]|nr:hypothetical protein [Chloroflexota bacterium]